MVSRPRADQPNLSRALCYNRSAADAAAAASAAATAAVVRADAAAAGGCVGEDIKVARKRSRQWANISYGARGETRAASAGDWLVGRTARQHRDNGVGNTASNTAGYTSGPVQSRRVCICAVFIAGNPPTKDPLTDLWTRSERSTHTCRTPRPPPPTDAGNFANTGPRVR
jgi:hypothetical protein